MGLDFNLTKAHWSYSGFNNFRRRIASIIGIELDNMVGFGGKISWDTIDDNIKPLLSHSDCDGELSPEDCKIVEPRLRELVKYWDDTDYDKIQALRLVSGMKASYTKNIPLKFI
jgi:hypothetical protein